MPQNDDEILSPAYPASFPNERARIKFEFCRAYERYFQAPDKDTRSWANAQLLWGEYIEARERWLLCAF